MVLSMTGYGRAERADETFDLTVEIRSVNHKYFEFSSRLPRALLFAEDGLKKLCQSRISRGKVDVFVTLVDRGAADAAVEVDHALAKGYLAALKELSETYALPNGINAPALARFPDLLTVRRADIDEEAMWAALEETASRALDDFVAMRAREGEKLARDVLSRKDFLLEQIAFVEARAPETVAAYRARLEEKMRELLGDKTVDEQRLLTETALFADKIAVDEETVRLRSHIKQMETLFAQEGPIGRPLDFLVQEMNRETNTIGSKCQNVEIAHTVVAMKAEIEKIREQIQNIE
ncbi:MAG: YicC family protein [Clostridia bacterium]|nr:YicC family protein [Clostridia bacterium]